MFSQKSLSPLLYTVNGGMALFRRASGQKFRDSVSLFSKKSLMSNER